MTELFEPDKLEEELETANQEPQSGPDYIVLGFFVLAFASVFLLARWLNPSASLKTTGALILAVCYSAFWLFSKFLKRG